MVYTSSIVHGPPPTEHRLTTRQSFSDYVTISMYGNSDAVLDQSPAMQP